MVVTLHVVDKITFIASRNIRGRGLSEICILARNVQLGMKTAWKIPLWWVWGG